VANLKSLKNLGFAKGNNLGIDNAGGEYILLLNSDTVLLNDAVTIGLQALTAEKTVGVVGSKLVYPDGKVQRSCDKFPSISILLKRLLRLHFLFGEQRLGMGYDLTKEENNEVDWVWGTFFFFKKEILSHLPEQKLPDEFFMYAEDLQWGMVIRKIGYRIIYCPAAKVMHFVGGNNFKNKLVIQNSYKLIRREHGTFYFRIYRFIYEGSHFVNFFTNSIKKIIKQQ